MDRELQTKLLDLMDQTGCRAMTDDVSRNFAAGTPAFWSTQGYNNAPAGTFFATVNHFASIEKAQDDLKAHFARSGRDVTAEQWLDHLIPLNKAAVLDLLRAYTAAGTFRDYDELVVRARRYGWHALRFKAASAPETAATPFLQAAE